MFKTSLGLCLGLAIGMLFVAAPAQAGSKIKNITCEQFLELDETNQNNIVYWVEGAYVSESKTDVAAADVEIGYDAFGRPVAEVVTACKADKKASLLDKIKTHFK
jgi:hypothetical protein